MLQVVRREIAEYEVVVSAGSRRVAMNAGLAKAFSRVPAKDKAVLRRWMEIWCRDGDLNIPREKFKSQERFCDDKGRYVHVFAFKSYQTRLYGFSRVVDGFDTFFITAADPAKKDNVADHQIIRRSKVEAFRILDVLKIR